MAYTPMDYLGQYAQSQFEPIQNDFNNYMNLAQGDPAAWANQLGFETEEERRKRLQREAERRGNTVVTSTKVDTYEDGSQTHTTKQEIPAGAAPQNFAVNPDAEQEAAAAAQVGRQMSMAEQAHQQEMAARAAPQPQAAPAPAATGPAVPEQLPAAAPAANAPQAGAPVPPVPAMPAPSAGVQVAGATQMPPAAATAPVAPTQVGPTTTAAPPPPPAQPPAVSAAPAPAAAPTGPAWMQAANAAGNDFAKLLDVAAAHPESRGFIHEKLKAQVTNQRKQDEANQLFEAAKNGDLKAWNKIQQMIRPETGKAKEEVGVGDYVKAYIFAELGLRGLSEEYQNKIRGKDTTFGQVQLGGQNWTAEYDKQTGELIRARDDEGNVATKDTLNKLAAAGVVTPKAAPPSATATRIRDSEGTEWSQVPSPQGMKFFDNNGKQGVPKGRTVPIAVGSDLEIAQAKQDIETIARFGQQTAEERLKAFANTNKLRADRMLPLLSLSEMGLNPDGSLMTEATRRPGTTYKPAAETPPTATPTAVETPPQAPAQITTPPAAPARVTGPVAPAAVAAPGTTVPSAAPAMVTPAGTATNPPLPQIGAGGARAVTLPTNRVPTAQEMADAEAAKKQADAIALEREKARIGVAAGTQEDFEKKKNVIRAAMPATELNATNVLNTLNNIVTHPGFEKTVGLPNILNKPLSMIPQSDRREFVQIYNQLKGQEFLAAYNQLRGGGGISEKEGEKAEQAIAALNDTGISPKEFKKNLWIFRDAVQTGIDNQRALIGLPPKYAGTPDQEEAKAWLRENPNHPKAEAIRKKLVGF